MKFRSIAIMFCAQLLFFAALTQVHAEDGSQSVENLQSLVAHAISRNPELKASEARWQMFTNRIRQAGSWDDPMMMLKIQNGIVTDPLNFSRDSMTQKVVGISQQIPFFGKRALKGEVAAREAESYLWSHAERKLELIKMVKETYYQLYFNDRSRKIVDKNIRIIDDFILIAETRYAVGQGVQQDIFKAQLERSKMIEMKISLEQQRKSLTANLNALLYRPRGHVGGRNSRLHHHPGHLDDWPVDVNGGREPAFIEQLPLTPAEREGGLQAGGEGKLSGLQPFF